MPILSILLLLLLVSLIAPLLDRWYRRKVAAAQNSPTVPVRSTFKFPTQLAGAKGKVQQQVVKLLGNRWTLSDESLQNWLAALFAENSDEQLWLAGLTPGQFAKLRSNLNSFCRKLDIDLVWLAGEPSFRPTKLEEAGKTIVTHYCQAVRQALLMSDDMSALELYRAFLANPTNKQNLAFGQKLFARLVEEGLIAPASPDLMMATDKERQTYVIQAIQTASRNESSFQDVLNRVAARELQSPIETAEDVPAVHNSPIVADLPA